MALTNIACQKAEAGPTLRKLSDGGGLQLWVQPTGTRTWRMAYRFAGKQKSLVIGQYPLISLADARRSRDEVKRLIAQGVDPAAEKQRTKAEQAAERDSFRTLADEYLDKLRREGRSPATMNKLEWLIRFTDKKLGKRPIVDITPTEILTVLRSVEERGRYESARRLRSTIGSVFRYAVATGRASSDPTYMLQGALTTPTVTPRAAVTEPKALGGLLRAIDAFDGQPTTGAALQLMALLFPRPGELRTAEWSEFDLEEGVWTIPASRTKMRREHKTPLSPQALDVLRHLGRITGDDGLVFPSIRSRLRCISDGALNAALRRMGYAKDEVTAHGFRATASTLLNESGLWNSDAIERQLAHVENNDVRRAYARGQHWDERVRMMRWWADALDHLRKGGDRLPKK